MLANKKTYTVVEIFYSIQGEGLRAGCPSVFIRFAGCNLDCKKATHGFDCDTDFSRGEKYTAERIAEVARAAGGDSCGWVILTGGEPALQVTPQLLRVLKTYGFHIAIETNGTVPLPPGIDFICVSPKGANPRLKVHEADEVKYVLAAGDEVPKVRGITAKAYLLSPAWEVESKTDPQRPGVLSKENLEWCISGCLENPMWRLSVQQHKWFKIR